MSLATIDTPLFMKVYFNMLHFFIWTKIPIFAF